MSEIERADRRSTTKVLHPDLYLITAIAVIWSLAVVGFVFLGYAHGLLTEGVIVAFSLIAFGIPTLLWRVYRRSHAKAGRRSLRDWLARRIEILTGPIESKQAALQVLLIPCAAAVAFTAIALVDVAERTVH